MAQSGIAPRSPENVEDIDVELAPGGRYGMKFTATPFGSESTPPSAAYPSADMSGRGVTFKG